MDAFGGQTTEAGIPLITESPEGRAATQMYSSMKSLHAFAACVRDFFTAMICLLPSVYFLPQAQLGDSLLN